jgi:hypothetical protein
MVESLRRDGVHDIVVSCRFSHIAGSFMIANSERQLRIMKPHHAEQVRMARTSDLHGQIDQPSPIADSAAMVMVTGDTK